MADATATTATDASSPSSAAGSSAAPTAPTATPTTAIVSRGEAQKIADNVNLLMNSLKGHLAQAEQVKTETALLSDDPDNADNIAEADEPRAAYVHLVQKEATQRRWCRRAWR